MENKVNLVYAISDEDFVNFKIFFLSVLNKIITIKPSFKVIMFEGFSYLKEYEEFIACMKNIFRDKFEEEHKVANFIPELSDKFVSYKYVNKVFQESKMMWIYPRSIVTGMFNAYLSDVISYEEELVVGHRRDDPSDIIFMMYNNTSLLDDDFDSDIISKKILPESYFNSFESNDTQFLALHEIVEEHKKHIPFSEDRNNSNIADLGKYLEDLDYYEKK